MSMLPLRQEINFMYMNIYRIPIKVRIVQILILRKELEIKSKHIFFLILGILYSLMLPLEMILNFSYYK